MRPHRRPRRAFRLSGGNAMAFSQAVASGFQNYVNFQGRASRSEYWWWVLFIALVTAGLDLAQTAVGSASTLGASLTMMFWAFKLGVTLPSLALTVRRLHDTGHSGRWIFIGFTVIGAFYPLLYWYCRPGTPGAGRYGPNPLEMEPAAA